MRPTARSALRLPQPDSYPRTVSASFERMPHATHVDT